MRRTGAFFLFALVSVPRAAWPQGNPLGPEFRVNTYTTSNQGYPVRRRRLLRQLRRRLDSDGQDGSSYGVFGQRYASSGAPLGPEFRVNTYTTGDQSCPVRRRRRLRQLRRRLGERRPGRLGLRRLRPALRQLRRAPRPGVPRQHLHDGLSALSVRGRRLLRQLRRRLGERRPGRRRATASSASATPAPAPPSARSSASTPTRRTLSAVRPSPRTPPATSSSSGTSDGQDGSGSASSASATPAPALPSARSSASTPTRRATGASVRRRRRLRQLRRRLGQRQQDGSATASSASATPAPAPPSAPSSASTPTRRASARSRRPSPPTPPATSSSSGRATQDGSSDGVFGQRYASSGAPLGPEFRVNTYTTNSQDLPSVASDASGNFVVVWQQQRAGRLGYGVFGQRYGQIVPVELMRFTVE